MGELVVTHPTANQAHFAEHIVKSEIANAEHRPGIPTEMFTRLSPRKGGNNDKKLSLVLRDDERAAKLPATPAPACARVCDAMAKS